MNKDNLKFSSNDQVFIKALSNKINADPNKKAKVKRLQQIIKENRDKRE